MVQQKNLLINRLHILLESLWLLALAGIPIIAAPYTSIVSESSIAHIELPKVALLKTVVSLMIIIVLWEWALRQNILSFRQNINLRRLPGHITGNPYSWIILAVCFLGLSTALSTLFSVHIDSSIRGVIPGQDGYSLINILSYMTLFLIVTKYLKTRSQLKRIATTVITLGTLLGILGIIQHLGFDVFQLSSDWKIDRIPLSTGNALFAGSLLVMTIGVTFIVCTIDTLNQEHSTNSQAHKLVRSLAWSAIIGVQTISLMYTLSRGPWVALATSLIIMIIAYLIWLNFRMVRRLIFIVLISISITIIGVQWSGNQNSGVNPSDITQRISSIQSETLQGGLNQRTAIWMASTQIAISRPWFNNFDLSHSWARSILGYGPEMFRYVFQIKSPLDTTDTYLPIEAHNAHNFFIHQWVEQGFLGLSSSVLLFLSALSICTYQLLRKHKKMSNEYKIIIIGAIALVSGRIIEQSVGVGRISDLTVFWILLAVIPQIPHLMSDTSDEIHTDTNHLIYRTRVNKCIYAVVFLLTIVICYNTTIHTTNDIRSAQAASKARYYFSNNQINNAISEIQMAISLSPTIPTYYLFENLIINRSMETGSVVNTLECPPPAENNERRLYHTCLLNHKYNNAEEAARHQHMYWRAIFEQAVSLDQLEKYDEALSLYQKTVSLIPNSWILHNELTKLYISIGDHNQALIHVNNSLRITDNIIDNEDATNLLGVLQSGMNFTN